MKINKKKIIINLIWIAIGIIIFYFLYKSYEIFIGHSLRLF